MSYVCLVCVLWTTPITSGIIKQRFLLCVFFRRIRHWFANSNYDVFLIDYLSPQSTVSAHWDLGCGLLNCRSLSSPYAVVFDLPKTPCESWPTKHLVVTRCASVDFGGNIHSPERKKHKSNIVGNTREVYKVFAKVSFASDEGAPKKKHQNCRWNEWLNCITYPIKLHDVFLYLTNYGNENKCHVHLLRDTKYSKYHRHEHILKPNMSNFPC